MEKVVSLQDFDREMEKRSKYRLIAITAIDTGKIFQLLYQFDKRRKIETIAVNIKKKKPALHSVAPIWPNAELFEREIHDFFGIEFRGNPRLHEMLFLPESWKEGPPLLKRLRANTSAEYQKEVRK
jgi:NADH-quinone oxidoreductase subunit C